MPEDRLWMYLRKHFKNTTPFCGIMKNQSKSGNVSGRELWIYMDGVNARKNTLGTFSHHRARKEGSFHI